MYKETNIIKIDSKGIIKLPSFIKANPGEELYFRKDFYDEEKIMIIDSTNLHKIGVILKQLRSENKITGLNHTKISRFIYGNIYSATCQKDKRIKVPLDVKYTEFTCEEVNTKIKKFILTPVKGK